MRVFIKIYCAVMFVMALLLIVTALQSLSEAMSSVGQMRELGQLEGVSAFDIFSFYLSNIMFNTVYALLLGAAGLILLQRNAAATPDLATEQGLHNPDETKHAEDFWSLPSNNSSTNGETEESPDSTDES